MKRSIGLLLFLLIFSYRLHPGVTEAVNSQQDIIRIHVLAHNDTPEEQAAKLMVRDAVTALIVPLLHDLKDSREAQTIITQNLGAIKAVAEQTLQTLSLDHCITIHWGDFAFPTRHYGKVAYLAGVYRSLNVVIGEGQGKNWWCVMYPPLCYIEGVVNVDEEVSYEFYFLKFLRRIWLRIAG